MQQVLGMLTHQQGMIQDLREEVREIREKQNADKVQPENHPEDHLENHPEGNTEEEQP